MPLEHHLEIFQVHPIGKDPESARDRIYIQTVLGMGAERHEVDLVQGSCSFQVNFRPHFLY